MAFTGMLRARPEREAGPCNLSDEERRYQLKLRSKMNAGFGFPDGPTKVFDFLYLGGEDEAMNKPLLSELGITHVINCAAGYCSTGTKYYGSAIQRYVEFEAEDDDGYDMMQHFKEAHDVIEDARQSGGKALIHCLMGVNRSGALAVAYAMLHQRWGPITAAVYIRTRRKWLLSNETFQAQIINFAREHDLLQLDAGELTTPADAKDKPKNV
jgi:hypothetical protein